MQVREVLARIGRDFPEARLGRLKEARRPSPSTGGSYAVVKGTGKVAVATSSPPKPD